MLRVTLSMLRCSLSQCLMLDDAIMLIVTPWRHDFFIFLNKYILRYEILNISLSVTLNIWDA